MKMEKPTKTLADYLVIAVSPALIIVLVHSVCFFLVDVFYRGEAAGGVRWVLFWFVLAVVLIARIGIEQGTGHALGYGLLLAGATWVYLSTVQPNVIFGAILLGVVWFTAHKITCNCTLVDDEVDASGQGLLQSLRSLSWRGRSAAVPAADSGGVSLPEAVPGQPTRRAGARPAGATGKAAAPSRPQIPGIWLLYYSLAALPIFGLGQTLLAAGDLAARHRGFVHLFFYLAAALGLLITTSFLGLRRYLRQRYLVMPGNLALGWIQFGVAGAVLVLGLSLLLPRPGAGEAWGALRYHVDYQLRRASDYATRFNPHGSGSGRAGHEPPPSGQQENQPPPSGSASGSAPNEHTSAADHGDQPAQANPKADSPEGKAGGDRPANGAPAVSAPTGSLYPWLKALFYLLMLICAVWLCYRYRAMIGTMLRSIWTAIRNFIAALLGLFQSSPKAPAVTPQTREVRPFKMFKNPFLTGGDRVWSPEQLIIYTYDALRSWAQEQEAPPGSPQTPREFCRQLGGELPPAATSLEHLAFLYGHVAYGASVPGNFDREQLRSVWELISNPRPVEVIKVAGPV